jgi:methylmalonyl-CoA mutase N-terminal domain/subunit
VAVQALAAVLGGTQSLHTNGYDEALSLPTEDAAKLALRTQQIVAEESGVASTADPLGGSWYVESLTDELEAEARQYLDRIDELGDVARTIPFMSEEIHQAAYRWQLELESGERRVVGVNCYEEATDPPRLEQPDFARLGREQIARLAKIKADRDDGAVTSVLERVGENAGASKNLVPVIVEAVKARATIGEISGVLRDRWGTFQA